MLINWMCTMEGSEKQNREQGYRIYTCRLDAHPVEQRKHDLISFSEAREYISDVRESIGIEHRDQVVVAVCVYGIRLNALVGRVVRVPDHLFAA